jgi:hypothetical protein
MGLGTQVITPSFKAYFLAFSLPLKSMRGHWTERSKEAPGASRLTGSHTLGYCVEKDFCLQGQNRPLKAQKSAEKIGLKD